MAGVGERSQAGRCVLAPDSGSTADTEDVPDPQAVGGQVAPQDAMKPKSQVTVWHEGLAWSVLSVDYQRNPQPLRTGTGSTKGH